MHLSNHLTFCGHCEAAFRFYERLLGGNIVTMLTYGDAPMGEPVPPEWRDKIVHASLEVAGTVLSGVDVRPENYEQPKGFYILLSIGNPAETQRIFRGLAESGIVHMPLQETFWSPCFGVLVDQFGIPWEISCEQNAE